ncbi:MAG: MBL fold metallo-hydrolase [Atribacterota bacterium]|nr:MBL fold metallo-hydrolase [Atribacterota bacterium]
MQIAFWGAAREVTGSCYLVTTGKGKFLVDCGMFQGKEEEKTYQPFPFPPGEIRFLLLTHAHLDHSGRIPLLFKQGFRGKVYATAPTIELCEILWLDTVKLMQEEMERLNRKNVRAGKPEAVPLFNEEDVVGAMGLFEPVAYDELHTQDGIEFVFRNAAHILGAATIEVWAEGTKVVFSGDLGPFSNVMEGSPPIIEEADFVVIESTYGDRRHRSLTDTRQEFEEVVGQALHDGGKILVPSFVVDRAQRVLYELFLLKNKIRFDCPVFFDSPMGTKVTDIYLKYRHLLAGEMQRFNLSNENPFTFSDLHYVVTPAESKALNEVTRAIVIAGSGMCSGGRIVHHLKHNLYRESTRVIFVGFQAQGTLGRMIVDGVRQVRIMGEEIAVRAGISTINGFSAHADREDLLRWAGYFKNRPTFLVTHGESSITEGFAQALGERGSEVYVPQFGDVFDLRKKALTAGVFPPVQREDLVSAIEQELQDLKGDHVILDEKALALLRSALILVEETKARTLNQ